MGETFHRRGHHSQRAHGRRTSLAADNSHRGGGMIALMPSAADARRLALPGGEPAPELHCTLFFLGDDGDGGWTEEQRDELEGRVRSLVAGMHPVTARVFGVAHWNGGSDKPAWVWNVGDDPEAECAGLGELRVIAGMALSMTADLPEIPDQHSPWAAHICAAYDGDLTLVRELEKRLGPVTFDRVRISFGDDDRDVPLEAEGEGLTAAGFRRAPLPQEDGEDFAEHNRQWETAVSSVTSRLYAELADWRTQIREQIAAGADTPEELAGISVETGDAAEILGDAMTDLARRAGQSLQRQAERQGVTVPEWTLPDDTVTAAVGGRRLLRSVAAMTSDLLASSMLQSAKRVLTGMLTRDVPPEALASAVDEVLREGQEAAVKGPVGTAMSTAQTAGRQAVLEAAPPGEYYASEILDKNTCAPCKAVDGEQFGSLEIAIKAYPVMGYKDCVGPRYGNSCRGMIVARWTPEEPEDEARTASAATMRADTVMIGEDDVPWHKVQNHSECPAGEPWAVVKDSDGSVSGCHGSEADADSQLSALYANEGKSTVTTAEELRKGEPSEGTKKDKRLKENKYGHDGEHECPPGMVPDKATGKCVEADEVEMAARSGALEVQGPAPEDIGGENTAPWRGPLTVEGIETGDGREFDSGALTWADLPLPLRWNKEDSHGGDPHTVAVNVGRIDRIWREENGLVMGEGLLDLSDDDGRRVRDKIAGKFLRGVSVDVDSIKDADMELIYAEQPDSDGEGPDPFDLLFASPEKVVFHKGRIRAATLVDIPAFAEAYIALLDSEGTVVAGGERAGQNRQFGRATLRSPVISPARPPADWFTNPDLSVPTGITVTPEGRVYGHAALWGTCHIGQAGVCVTPPHEDSHPYFMTGSVLTEEGRMASVGQITLGTGHADVRLGYRAAAEHYDNTGTAVADVAVGNDVHGIWVAGAVRPSSTPDRVRELRASGQVSGDWRTIGGNLRLVGLLAVNVPGFPVPKLRTKIVEGTQFSLVAAGAPHLTEEVTEAELDQWAYGRIMNKLAERVRRGR